MFQDMEAIKRKHILIKLQSKLQDFDLWQSFQQIKVPAITSTMIS